MTPWSLIEWTAAFCGCVALVGGTVLIGAHLATWLEHRAAERSKT